MCGGNKKRRTRKLPWQLWSPYSQEPTWICWNKHTGKGKARRKYAEKPHSLAVILQMYVQVKKWRGEKPPSGSIPTQ